jgi:hypothetical protein
MLEEPQSPERRRRLRDIVTDAFEIAIQTTDLSGEALEKGVVAVVDSVGRLARTPGVDEVAAVVKVALEKSGEGAVAAAEAAGDIAEKIVDGLSEIDLDLNI